MPASVTLPQVAEMVNERGMEVERKGQVSGIPKGAVKERVLFINRIFGVDA
jgi:hypothetical protein